MQSQVAGIQSRLTQSEPRPADQESRDVEETTCCIVGDR